MTRPAGMIKPSYGDLPLKKYYRPDEVAKILQVSIRTAYRRIGDRTIPSVKIGSTIRIPAAEFHASLKRLAVGND